MRSPRGFVGDDFRLDVNQFRACIQREDAPLPDVPIEAWLDQSFTANEKSDRSAFIASCKTPREDGLGDFVHVVGCRTQRWRGGELAEAALDFCAEHSAKTLHIEGIPATDLLADMIKLKCEIRGLEPPSIKVFAPIQRYGAKNSRIRMLSTLFDVDPPALKLYPGAHVWQLLEEVEKFIPCPSNRGRQVNLLDALAISAGFR